MDPDSPTPLNPVDSDCPSPPASDDPDATDTSDMQSNRQSNGSTSLPSSQRSSTTHAEPSSSAVQAPHDECIAESSQAPTRTTAFSTVRIRATNEADTLFIDTRHGAITAMRRLNRMYRREATAIERIDHLLQLADECESAGLTTKAIRRYETIIRIVDFIAMVNKEDDPDFWLEIDDFTLVYDPFNEFEEKLKQQDEFDDL